MIETFGEELQSIGNLHEELQQYRTCGNLAVARRIVKENNELFVRNWRTAVSLTGLSHDPFSTELILGEVNPVLQQTQRNEFFKFLLNLDRTLEIDGMQQLQSVVASRPEDEFMRMLENWRETRIVIHCTLRDELCVCVLNKSNIPTFINHH